MPYTLIKTNGTTLTIVQDGTVDNTTSLTFVGKNFTGYGDPVNENFVKLIENFANSTAPSNPLTGQLWFDLSTNKLKFYNGGNYKPIAVITTGTVKPTDAVLADLHFDGSLLWTYTGSTWLRIGPLAGSGATSGNALQPTSVFVESGGANSSIQIGINGVSFVVSTSSSYAVAPEDPIYNEFSGLYPGINLSGTSNTATSNSTLDSRGVSAYYDGTAAYGNLFWGTSGSALGLVDYTNSIPHILRSTDFITKDSLSQLGALSVNDDAGITINQVFQLHVTRETGIGESNISNIKNNVIKFNINDPSHGTYTNFINFDARSGFFRVLPTTSTSVSIGSSDVGGNFSDIYVTNVESTNISASSMNSTVSTIGTADIGNLAVSGNITASSIQLLQPSTISGSNILTSATLNDNAQLTNGAGYLTSSTVVNFVVNSVQGTANQINAFSSSGNIILSLANNISAYNIVSTGSISANAMSVQGSPVLTAASFSGTGVTIISGTPNQIAVSTAGTQVTVSLPSSLQINSLDGNVITMGGSLVLTSGTAVSSLYPGTTGLLLNGSASRSTGDVTLSGVLNAGNGGTGQSNYNTGDLLYADSNNPAYLARLTAVASGNALISQGVNTVPTWGKISLTSNITDTLSVGNGGTGSSGSLTGYVYGSGGAAMSASSTIPGNVITGNISGNSANISSFTVNQNVGTGNSPTFAGLTVNGQLTVSSATVTTSAVNLGQYSFGKSVTGYAKFPNGLIIQWGNMSSTGGIFNYPIQFPTVALQLFATNTTAQGSYVDNAFGYVISSSQFYLATKPSNSSGSSGYPCAWFAIGY